MAELGSEMAPEGMFAAAPNIWRLQIKPGADAVLLIACFLALSAFRLSPGCKHEQQQEK